MKEDLLCGKWGHLMSSSKETSHSTAGLRATDTSEASRGRCGKAPVSGARCQETQPLCNNPRVYPAATGTRRRVCVGWISADPPTRGPRGLRRAGAVPPRMTEGKGGGAQGPRLGPDWRAGCGRIRCLYGREAGLQGEGEHGAVAQLVQPVVVVPELLDQHAPPGRVQQVLEQRRAEGLQTLRRQETQESASPRVEGNGPRHHASSQRLAPRQLDALGGRPVAS